MLQTLRDFLPGSQSSIKDQKYIQIKFCTKLIIGRISVRQINNKSLGDFNRILYSNRQHCLRNILTQNYSINYKNCAYIYSFARVLQPQNMGKKKHFIKSNRTAWLQRPAAPSQLASCDSPAADKCLEYCQVLSECVLRVQWSVYASLAFSNSVIL